MFDAFEIEQARSRDRQTRCRGSRPIIDKQNRGRIFQRDIRSDDARHSFDWVVFSIKREVSPFTGGGFS